MVKRIPKVCGGNAEDREHRPKGKLSPYEKERAKCSKGEKGIM